MDKKRSAYWYRQAALQGSIRGQLLLAWAYYWGDGVRPDYRRAYYWMYRAAEQGHPLSQTFLSGFYRRGIGVRQSTHWAEKWLGAARWGVKYGAIYQLPENPPGRIPFQLARWLICWQSRSPDLIDGRRLLAEAAQKGHPRAGAALNARLENGTVRKKVCKEWHRVRREN